MTAVTRAPASDARNQVRLCGRLSSEPVERNLPSGDQLVSFRLVLAREATSMTRHSRQHSDWVVCTAWTPGLRRRVVGWEVGDVVEVEGALRRRFYRGERGASSSVEVEMLGGRRLRRGRARDSPQSRGAPVH